jgi:hypothetical protein
MIVFILNVRDYLLFTIGHENYLNYDPKFERPHY